MDNATPRFRIVTAASLFDGHDAAINIMRRILQRKGVEVIHLGHNRSVLEVVECALEEDAHAVAITSYQGGHLEYFRYLRKLLDENQGSHIRIFGGGGGTILAQEIEFLQQEGISKIYSPEDGLRLGLDGMIEDLLLRLQGQWEKGDPEMEFGKIPFALHHRRDIITLARAISRAELGLDYGSYVSALEKNRPTGAPPAKVVGITGTGGAGKSSLCDELIRRFLENFPDKTLAIVSVDPTKKKSGGALLGDRIRMNAVHHPRVYMRSMATRETDRALSGKVGEALQLCKHAGFDLILLESAGTGQSDTSILEFSDWSLYVMTPEYGAASQLEKINMLDYADWIALNKMDKPGGLDALQEIRKQYRRNHNLFQPSDEALPVVATTASRFSDPGMDHLFDLIMERAGWHLSPGPGSSPRRPGSAVSFQKIIPPARGRYLSEISSQVRSYNQLVEAQAKIASRCYQIQGALQSAEAEGSGAPEAATSWLKGQWVMLQEKLTPVSRKLLAGWERKKVAYLQDQYQYNVRDQIIRQDLYHVSLSGTRIPKVLLPTYRDWGDLLRWQAQENAPGLFPFTAGVFPLRREGEDPTRMFAGEGTPERTNRRFHYLSQDQPAHRLSTAFDSVTLYGENPGLRPDIFGKIGNSGVNIATVDDAKKLYSGFDLCDPKTSVSMTINGPAPIVLAFFLNAAIDQQCERWITQEGSWDRVHATMEALLGDQKPSYQLEAVPSAEGMLGLGLLGVSGADVLDPEVFDKIKKSALSQVRGTVQADILKEDQAQNTCIFSTEFALKMMGDVQQYFIDHDVRNFYSISISGYHIAEAGANPITQLAFTLANGFTYVEYFLSRGMGVDQFAGNLSFFFSNGMDAEYSVIGRVARRIWAKAMKYVYRANKRSQMLKYHIQTSGRSLHAQEVDFNDIRTTLQALYALYDNCNSLHTNAYDEAITTPTEQSVRRAMAIQLIINRELGSAKTENFLQGSFFIEALTDLVEEAVLREFDRISERGGVLGAMERMYQRNKIQEESLVYEQRKHDGTLPIVGVNTFVANPAGQIAPHPTVVRSTSGEKDQQIRALDAFHHRWSARSAESLARLQSVARSGGNLFEALMEAVRYCSLGQITHALYQVGGQYRRNM